eukprot:8477096-Alexandrium_andersonii.AAC.1
MPLFCKPSSSLLCMPTGDYMDLSNDVDMLSTGGGGGFDMMDSRGDEDMLSSGGGGFVMMDPQWAAKRPRGAAATAERKRVRDRMGPIMKDLTDSQADIWEDEITAWGGRSA